MNIKKPKRFATIVDVDERVEKLAIMTANGFEEVRQEIRESEKRIIDTLGSTLGGIIADLDTKLSAYTSRTREDMELLDTRVTALEKR